MYTWNCVHFQIPQNIKNNEIGGIHNEHRWAGLEQHRSSEMEAMGGTGR